MDSVKAALIHKRVQLQVRIFRADGDVAMEEDPSRIEGEIAAIDSRDRIDDL